MFVKLNESDTYTKEDILYLEKKIEVEFEDLFESIELEYSNVENNINSI